MRRREFLGALAAAAAPWPALGQPQRRPSMRPLYVDVTGKTDANGATSIPVKLPTTGEWHNGKLTIGTTATAEWAVLVNGRPYTYGRGRRVTLGPELLQDGEKLTVSVTGGPPLAQIDGTLTGLSGSPAEIMAGYTPAPNTIALDVTGLGNAGANVSSSNSPFTLIVPAGSISLLWRLQTSTQAAGQITVTGAVTGNPYLGALPFSNQLGSTSDRSGAVDLDPADTSLTISILNTLNTPTVDFWLLPVAAAIYQAPNTTFKVSEASGPITPAPWQAAKTSTAFAISPAGLNTDFTVVAAAAGQTIYLHDLNVVMNAGANYEFALWDGPSAGGLQVVELAQIFVTAAGVVPNLRWDGHGRPLTSGNALIGTQISGPGGLKFFGTLGYSQA